MCELWFSLQLFEVRSQHCSEQLAARGDGWRSWDVFPRESLPKRQTANNRTGPGGRFRVEARKMNIVSFSLLAGHVC